MANIETEQVEYKASLSDRDAIVDTVAAFATSNGGRICIGISPDGTRSGLMIGDNTLAKLANDVKRATEPPQFPSLSTEGDPSSAVIVITVSESPVKPVFARSRPMKRVGDSNQVISREETLRLMEVSTGRSWDILTCEGFRLDDIDRDAVESFLKRAELDTAVDTEDVLRNLKLIRDGSLSRAAALLFAKDPQRYFLSAQVKCGRFAGTSSVRFLDEDTIYGNVVEQIDEAMAFVMRNIHHELIITGRPEREVVPQYPEEAVREAIVNAVCHRNYADFSHVQVRIYDDRLEVWNPGSLPPDLTLEMLYERHHSHPRNPSLAAALHRARVLEGWGTGTLRMVEACEARSMPRPQFTHEAGMFIVTFPLARLSELNSRQKQALDYVHLRGSITRSEYEARFGVAETQAKRDLGGLVEEGLLATRGKGPATKYVLPER